MDGVDGTVKKLVFRTAKSEKFSVKTLEDFNKAANLIKLSISSTFLPILEMLDEPPKAPNAPPIPETFQIHQI